MQKNINPIELEKNINSQQENFQIRLKERLCQSLNIYTFYISSTTYPAQKTIDFLNSRREIIAVQVPQKIVYRQSTSNDPHFSEQWNLMNTGQLGGTFDADVDAELAWNYGQGDLTKNNDTIVIAVVDAGFDILHEDLHFWKNKYEIANDLVDNDNNGYIDDYQGWNIKNGNGNTYTGITNSNNIEHWHGTAVCGSAAAIGNNAKGISGIANNTQILPIHLGDIFSDSIIKAYDYVIKMRERYNSSNGDSGAFVVAINSSFGISDSPSNNTVWCNLYDYMGSIGILNATATNNAYVNYDIVDDMPGSCSSNYIINTSYSDKKDEIGNCGYGKTNVDLAAPSEEIYVCLPGNQYQLSTGTSFASPQVAGAVAVLYSAACDSFLTVAKNNPDTAALLIRQFILSGVNVKSTFENKFSSNGRLNVYNAVNKMREFCNEKTINPPLSNEFKIFWTSEKDGLLYFNFDLINKGTPEIYIYDNVGKKIGQYTTNELEAGNYTQTISLSNLSSSTYFIQLMLNRKLSNVKIFFNH
ncbi:MAG: S8 family serine peptidase [Flavobacteriales bacterium]